MSLVGLVVFVLAVNGAMETWISYSGTRTSLTDAMDEKAEATAKRIEQSMADLERQISWVTRASANRIDVTQEVEQHRADYAQLLNQVPSVNQLSFISGRGREQLRLSRAGGQLRQQCRFLRRQPASPKRSPAAPALRRPISATSGRIISIALSHSGPNAGVTVAEIDLRFLNDYLERRPGRPHRRSPMSSIRAAR